MLIDKYIDKHGDVELLLRYRDREHTVFLSDAVLFHCDFEPVTAQEERIVISHCNEWADEVISGMDPRSFSNHYIPYGMPEDEMDLNMPYDNIEFDIPLTFANKRVGVWVLRPKKLSQGSISFRILGEDPVRVLEDSFTRLDSAVVGEDYKERITSSTLFATHILSVPEKAHVGLCWPAVPIINNQDGEIIVNSPVCVTHFIVAHHILKLLALLNCKNVTTITHHAPEKLQKARRKRNKLPLLSYKTIEINLSDDAPRHVTKYGETKGNSRGTRLHMIRGKYRTYTKEKPLFGRHVGRWWWQPRAAGDIRNGKIEKDYRVTA